jgi:hypothetical protein
MNEAVARRATDVFEAHRDPEFPRPNIVLFGGEPLLNWQLIDAYLPWVSERFQDRRRPVILFTNGIAATTARLDFILGHGGTVYVSLDGEFEHHRIHRPVSREQYDHVLAMIRHCVRTDPSRVVPFVVLRRQDVPRTHTILDFVASLGAETVAISKDQGEDWSGEDRSRLTSLLKRWRWRRATRLRVFPDSLCGCEDCSPVGMMVYPGGEVYDLCHVCASLLRGRGLIRGGTDRTTYLGHVESIDRLELDVAAKRRVIRGGMDCRTLHATSAEYASLFAVATRAEQTAAVLADLFSGRGQSAYGW